MHANDRVRVGCLGPPCYLSRLPFCGQVHKGCTVRPEPGSSGGCSCSAIEDVKFSGETQEQLWSLRRR
eukprot:12552892-Heterocapsa_arctica.AAC.1